jgi:vacuolar protein sorting-associated protein 16
VEFYRNLFRSEYIQIPLRFNHLKPNVLLDRLVFRKHYGLAIQIAKHLKLPETRILEHWAFYKIIHDKDDDEIAKKIAAKFRNPTSQNVSFCTVAKKAQEIGKKRLAILLLDLEPKQSLQVPILLNLGEHKKALMAATQSGDTDLIYMVLLQLKEITPLADFQMTIRAFPLAQNLYKKYCQLHSPATLKDIYTQEDDYVSHARLALRDSNDAGELNMSLPLASTFYKKAQKPVETELCDETRKLLKLQQILDKKYTIDFSGLSLHATIKHLLNLGDVKLADKMRSEYKVPERRYWWLRIQVLADQFRWDELDKFSKTKKSPIGYEPFVEVCLAHQKVDEAQKYLPKCDGERKVKLHLRAGLYEEAAQIAYEQKDLNVLFTMMNSIPPNCYAAIGKVEAFIAQLSTKK